LSVLLRAAQDISSEDQMEIAYNNRLTLSRTIFRVNFFTASHPRVHPSLRMKTWQGAFNREARKPAKFFSQGTARSSGAMRGSVVQGAGIRMRMIWCKTLF